MTLRIETFPAGPIETNAYLVIDETSKEALIVDAPIDSVDQLMSAVSGNGVTVGLLYITHAHWDHIGDAAAMKTRTGAPLAAHRLCQQALEQPLDLTMVRGRLASRRRQCQQALEQPVDLTPDLPFVIEPATVDRFLDEGDTVQLGSLTFQVLHLPGHEPGHTALYSEPDRVLLSGDVLFPNGHGRVDIPGAYEEEMAASLSRLAKFPADVTVYPGHGSPTTIGAEPWLQSYVRQGEPE